MQLKPLNFLLTDPSVPPSTPYLIAEQLGREPEVLIASFRGPISDMCEALSIHAEEPLHASNFFSSNAATKTFPGTQTPATFLAQSILATVDSCLGADYLGKLAAFWLGTTWLEDRKVLFWDATRAWIAPAASHTTDRQIIHLYSSSQPQDPRSDDKLIYLNDPTDIPACLAAMERELS